MVVLSFALSIPLSMTTAARLSALHANLVNSEYFLIPFVSRLPSLPSSLSPSLPTEMAQLMMQNEKLHRKVKKAQQRRDHYASLYYRTLAELDETKWELTMARNKIKEMRVQGEGGDGRKQGGGRREA